MKRIVAAALMVVASGLAACERSGVEDKAAADAAPPQARAEISTERASPAPAVAGVEAVAPIAEGAPAFAVLYPGGEIQAPPTLASGPAGPGGLVAFQTDADPETIVAFYRERAEAAGLSSVMAMNMGEARSYGAAKADAGANLQVVASPSEDGKTSVQLSWSAGG